MRQDNPQAPTSEHSGKPAHDTLLQVRDLTIEFGGGGDPVQPVVGLAFDIRRGETLALVGESGSGKSWTSLAIMRLVELMGGSIGKSQMLFTRRSGETIDLGAQSDRAMRRIRGNEIAMIFQEPMTSLNPVKTAGRQIAEAVTLHQNIRGAAARRLAIEMLDYVGIASPKARAGQFPHQMSGGMRQRVMIAMALSCQPSLLIADEPTTALDVTVQAQILDLLGRLQREQHMSILFITHDLGVVAETAHRIAVLYSGRLVETADVVDLYRRPRHPYTLGLLDCVSHGTARETGDAKKLRISTIPGSAASPADRPDGCAFAPRCFKATPECVSETPPIFDVDVGHRSACIHWQSLG